ncbi:MAG: TonB-dependent receptor [Elusimicrobia bacterium]|nr:TonB-dependent receptor [Elusimicrobiota bacterium]
MNNTIRSLRTCFFVVLMIHCLLFGPFFEVLGAQGEAFQFFEEEAQVITASRRLEPPEEAPSNITIITEQQIRDSGARTLSELLSALPGIQITTHRKGGEKIWIRGVTAVYNDKTILLIDGFPFKELIYGQHPIDEQLPLTNVKRIEIIKGPASVLYGANALGGVINLITKEPDDQPNAAVTAGLGSWNTQRYSVSMARQADWGGAVFSGTFYDSRGAHHDKDEDGNSTTRRDPNALKHMHLRLFSHSFSLGAYHGSFQTDEPGEPDTQTRTFTNNTSFLNLQWKHPLSEWLSLTARSYYNLFDWGNARRKFKSDGVTLKAVESTTEKTRMIGAGFLAELTRFKDHVVTAGFDFENEKGMEIRRTKIDTTAANPKETLIRFSTPPKPDRNNYGIFLDDHWKIHPFLLLAAGIRQDEHDQYGGQTSPRASLMLTPSQQWSAKLLYGNAFRAPTFRELYITETPKEDDGDPNLKPERIETVELDLQYSPISSLRTNLALYHNTIVDFVAPNSATLQYANMGNRCIYGLEPELRYQWGKRSYAFFNYTLLRARDANGNDMPDVAPEMFNLGLNAAVARYVNIFTILQHVGRRNRASNYQADVVAALQKDLLGAYDRVNLVLSTRDLPVDIAAGIYNVFDVQSFNPNYARGAYDMEHPGRSLMFEMRYAF